MNKNFFRIYNSLMFFNDGYIAFKTPPYSHIKFTFEEKQHAEHIVLYVKLKDEDFNNLLNHPVFMNKVTKLAKDMDKNNFITDLEIFVKEQKENLDVTN